ncbi:MAG: sulfite exporter TauE/SafE family protein [Pseudomonadota bacterium]
MDDLTNGAIALAVFAFLFAGLVKGAVGLGFSSTCLPILVLAVGLDRAMPLVLVPSIASNMMVHVQAGAFRATWTRFWPMFVAVIPGLCLGLYLLAQVNLDYAAALLGLVLIIYGAWTLGHIDAVLPERLHDVLRVPVGLLTGLVNGLTGSQIMPVLPYLLGMPLARNVFLQTINTSFTLSSLVVAGGLWAIGFLTPQIGAFSVAALIPMVVGVVSGTWLRNRMSTAMFRRSVLVVLIGLGLLLVGRAVVG